MGQFGHAILDSDQANDAIYDIITDILGLQIEDGHWRDRPDDVKDALMWPGSVLSLQAWLRNSHVLDYDIRAIVLTKVYMFAGVKLPLPLRLAARHAALKDKDDASLWDDYKPRAKIIRSFIRTLDAYVDTPTPLDDEPCEMTSIIKELQNKPKEQKCKKKAS